MIPKHPEWHLRGAQGGPYPAYVGSPQRLPNVLLQNIEIGPDALTVSGGKLNTRWWVVYTEALTVHVRPDENGTWGAPLALFTHTEAITAVDITFDQLGRPMVVIVDASNDLYLYWYDPTQETQVLELIKSNVTSAVAAFDKAWAPSDSDSDAYVFYVQNNEIFWLLQRDRWLITYGPEYSGEDVTLKHAAVNSWYEMQLEFIDEITAIAP